MEQLLVHLVGDYILQSYTMAVKKTTNTTWATYHAVAYTVPFTLLTTNYLSLLVICITHLLIDRYKLATYVTKLKNYLLGTLDTTALTVVYPEVTPAYLSTWLVIITDNTMHLVINYLALKL